MTPAGSYVLVLFVQSEAILEIGRLGTFVFPRGYYCYVGSARGPGGLLARLARHLRKRKRLRWHIDYLLERASIEEIWHAVSVERLECRWAQALLALPSVESSVPGFGSSDCCCLTHLSLLPPSSLCMLRQRLQALGAAVHNLPGAVGET